MLRPGAPIVLETINVACWYAFFQSYIRDITHARPLHPDTLKYLVTASGFADAAVEFRVPVPEADRLQRPPEIVWRPTGEDKDAIATLAKTVDDNATLLNRLLFTSLDYAVIARARVEWRQAGRRPVFSPGRRASTGRKIFSLAIALQRVAGIDDQRELSSRSPRSRTPCDR